MATSLGLRRRGSRRFRSFSSLGRFEPHLDAPVANPDEVRVQRKTCKGQAFAGIEAKLVAMVRAHEDAVLHRSPVERIPAMRTVVRQTRHLRTVAIYEKVFSAFPAHQHVAIRDLF